MIVIIYLAKYDTFENSIPWTMMCTRVPSPEEGGRRGGRGCEIKQSGNILDKPCVFFRCVFI